MKVAILRLPGNADLALPAYQSLCSAGMDIQAAVSEPVILRAGEVLAIPTGFALALPEGFEAQIRSRSGMVAQHGLCVANSPGTIDSDYRGEVKVLLTNISSTPFTVTRGMRIAQLIVAPIQRVEWAETSTLPITPRGAGGFGHTGR